MPDFIVTPYEGADFMPVVNLLHEVLIADPMTPALFARRVLLDPNFEPEGAPVARVDGEVVGFLLAIARRRPLEDGPDDRDRGWITLFGVAAAHRRKGIGRTLLEKGLDYLRRCGCASAHVSPYAPNYWTPGVDVAAYPEAVAFLERHGFSTLSRPLSMDTSLVGGWRVPEWVREREAKLAAEGVRIEAFDPIHIPTLTAFLRTHFPGDWQRYVRETILDIVSGRRAADDLLVAYQRETMVGFSQHEGERFGPFGVAASERGRGIGAVLMFRTLETMRRQGLHNAWFLWTDDHNARRVYSAAGFRQTRRYAVMRRDLTGENSD